MSSIFINEYNLNFKTRIIFIYTHCSPFVINFRTRIRIFACVDLIGRCIVPRKGANEIAMVRWQRHPFLNELLEG